MYSRPGHFKIAAFSCHAMQSKQNRGILIKILLLKLHYLATVHEKRHHIALKHLNESATNYRSSKLYKRTSLLSHAFMLLASAPYYNTTLSPLSRCWHRMPQWHLVFPFSSCHANLIILHIRSCRIKLQIPLNDLIHSAQEVLLRSHLPSCPNSKHARLSTHASQLSACRVGA